MNFLYYEDTVSPGNTAHYISNALERKGCYVWRYQQTPKPDIEHIRKICIQCGIDVLLISKAPELRPKDIRYLKEDIPGLTVCWWTFDWMRRDMEWYAPLAKVSDICFQNDGSEPDTYLALGINRIALHQAIDPTVHRIPDSITKAEVEDYSADVAFFGSLFNYGNRLETLEVVEEWCLRNGRTFKVWGSSTRMLLGLELAKAVYLSKIVIGHSSCDDKRAVNYWSNRVYPTLGCGGFFLAEYSPGYENEFENGKHFVWWKDHSELETGLDRWIDDEAGRRVISGTGYALVHRQHTYDHRVARMIEVITGYRKER